MIRGFSKFSEEDFNFELAQVDWGSILARTQGNVDIAFSKFCNKLNKLDNNHAKLKPLSKRKFKQSLKSWITKGLLKSIKIKANYLPQEISTNTNSVETKLQP